VPARHVPLSLSLSCVSLSRARTCIEDKVVFDSPFPRVSALGGCGERRAYECPGGREKVNDRTESMGFNHSLDCDDLVDPLGVSFARAISVPWLSGVVGLHDG
jgi:hypothetical protein